MIIYYEWEDDTATKYLLDSHPNQGHTFSHIRGKTSDPTNLPITGYYAGGTTSVTTNTGCSYYTFSDQVGHVSKIELATDSCLNESVVGIQTDDLGTGNGDGAGTKCEEGMNGPTYFGFAPNYIIELGKNNSPSFPDNYESYDVGTVEIAPDLQFFIDCN